MTNFRSCAIGAGIYRNFLREWIHCWVPFFLLDIYLLGLTLMSAFSDTLHLLAPFTQPWCYHLLALFSLPRACRHALSNSPALAGTLPKKLLSHYAWWAALARTGSPPQGGSCPRWGQPCSPVCLQQPWQGLTASHTRGQHHLLFVCSSHV